MVADQSLLVKDCPVAAEKTPPEDKIIFDVDVGLMVAVAPYLIYSVILPVSSVRG